MKKLLSILVCCATINIYGMQTVSTTSSEKELEELRYQIVELELENKLLSEENAELKSKLTTSSEALTYDEKIYNLESENETLKERIWNLKNILSTTDKKLIKTLINTAKAMGHDLIEYPDNGKKSSSFFWGDYAIVQEADKKPRFVKWKDKNILHGWTNGKLHRFDTKTTTILYANIKK